MFKTDKNYFRLTMLIILVLACVVRFWGIGFGLPNTECRPDETIIINFAMEFGKCDLNPHFFDYPTFYMYILFCFYILYFLIGMAFGRYNSLYDFIAEYSVSPDNFYLLNRFLVVILGVATVFVLYKVASYLFNKKTAVISSLFLSLAYLHVRNSHFGKVDIPATFFIMCSMAFIIKSYGQSTLKNYLWAGVLAGLATSVKYNAVILLFPMLVVHHFNVFNKKYKIAKIFADKRILFFIIAGASAFFISSPFILLDFRQFVSDFSRVLNVVPHSFGIDLGWGWWYHFRFSLFYGLGWSLLLASLLGVFVVMRINIRKAAILCSFPVIHYILFGAFRTVFLRYMIPVIPFLCITAAVFVVYIADKISIRKIARFRGITTFLLAGSILVPSAHNIVQLNNLLSKKDNRVVAKEWVNENIPDGSSIYQPFSPWGKLQFQPMLETLHKFYNEIIAEGKQGRPIKSKIDYFEKNYVPEYAEWTYNTKINKFEFKNKITKDFPSYIIIEESPLEIYSKVPPKIVELLNSSYHMKKSFKAVDVDDKRNFYQQQDAFYVPYAGFNGLKRPGPNFYIYEKHVILQIDRTRA